MDMEFSPGADMVISGPVHTNGNLIARNQTGKTNTLEFKDRVTAAKGFFANTGYKGSIVMNNGAVDSGPGGTGKLYFNSPSGTRTDIWSGSIWRDHFWGVSYTSPATASTTPPSTSTDSFKPFATTTYGNNLRTSVHGVTPLVLPSVADYRETDNPATAEDDRNNGRQILEVPKATDTAGLLTTKISRNAGLYIIVNPTAEFRDGILPDATTRSLCPFSYRCFLNRVNDDLTYTLSEVILPGQPSYGYNNAGTPSYSGDDYMYANVLPNRYLTTTSVGANQVLRIPQQPNPAAGSPTSPVTTPAAGTGYSRSFAPTYANFDDAYFYDLRRATNCFPTARSVANPYTPRPIHKIDFDMIRFKMAVERTLNPTTAFTSTVYYPSLPTNATQWSHFVYNPATTTTPAAYGLGTGATFNVFPSTGAPTAADPFMIYYAPSNPSDPALGTDPRTFAVGPGALYTASVACPWRDGISIYINSVDAEDRSVTGTNRNRADSAVRLWRGRGPAVSLPASTTRTGFTLATNDAVYIIGHFNADGAINSTSTSTTNPGGYSAVYPDSTGEYLTSIMGDAITMLSQPTFEDDSGRYVQTDGWSDAFSAHVAGSGSPSSSWDTSAPSNSNAYDGIDDSERASDMPNLSVSSSTGSVPNRSRKFDPVDTEISACLVIGIVPTNSDPSAASATVPATYVTNGPPSTGPNGQASGGVHNYPRLLEVWNGAGLYFRGSMVAMFESRVAMEPWSIRVYSAPGRFWGMNITLQASGAEHHVPLEPQLLNARRMRFLELTAGQYDSAKTLIEALPH